jgi:hypothetical protein
MGSGVGYPSATRRLSFVGEKKERAHYPWQIPIARRFPASELSLRQSGGQGSVKFFYLFELLLLEEAVSRSWSTIPNETCSASLMAALPSQERERMADWRALEAMGYFEA